MSDSELTSLDAYISHGHKSVPGWLYEADMLLMAFVGIAQNQLSVTGDICEIGVYKGKSLILLSMLLRERDRLHGVDVFVEDTLPQAQANVARLAPQPSRVSLHRINTLDLDAQALASILQPLPSLRYVHIDGGHEYFEVLYDLLLFAAHMTEGAVLVMDDVHDREFPGVSLALEHFCTVVRPGQRIVPFMVGQNKLFLCRAAYAQSYQSSLVRFPQLAKCTRIAPGPGHDVLGPFRRLPMLPEDLDAALKTRADSVVLSPSTTAAHVRDLARTRGSDELWRAMRRSGKTTEDLL
jgi:hypothetical protein